MISGGNRPPRWAVIVLIAYAVFCLLSLGVTAAIFIAWALDLSAGFLVSVLVAIGGFLTWVTMASVVGSLTGCVFYLHGLFTKRMESFRSWRTISCVCVDLSFSRKTVWGYVIFGCSVLFLVLCAILGAGFFHNIMEWVETARDMDVGIAMIVLPLLAGVAMIAIGGLGLLAFVPLPMYLLYRRSMRFIESYLHFLEI